MPLFLLGRQNIVDINTGPSKHLFFHVRFLDSLGSNNCGMPVIHSYTSSCILMISMIPSSNWSNIWGRLIFWLSKGLENNKNLNCFLPCLIWEYQTEWFLRVVFFVIFLSAQADGRVVHLSLIYPCFLGSRMLGSTVFPWFFSGSVLHNEDYLTTAFAVAGLAFSIVAYDYQVLLQQNEGWNCWVYNSLAGFLFFSNCFIIFCFTFRK